MELKDIQNLIKFVSKQDIAEFSYKEKDFEVKIKNPSSNQGGTQQIITTTAPAIQAPSPAVAPQASQSEPAKDTTSAEDDSKYITIKAPMIGTFYRKPSPDKPEFINVGDSVSEGTTVCVIEAMKLFNEIESEVSGKIVKVLVDDSSPVEYDQPLFLVDPS